MFYSFRATVEGQNVTLNETNSAFGKYEAIVILTAPLNTSANSRAELVPGPERRSSVPVQPPRIDSTSGYVSGIGQASFTERAGTPPRSFSIKEAPVVTPAVLVSDTLSSLYSDKTKREARRSSSIGDVYADVNRDIYQRIIQGEQISLVFEGGGNYISSPFVIVENGSQLYLSFYQFNEGKPIPQDKKNLLSQIFEIKGSIPDLVKICKPAQVVFRDGGYVIVKKGILTLEGS
jgi:hypothetical protein